MESEDGPTPKVEQPSTSTSHVRQSSVAAPTNSSVQRRTDRDAISIIGLRKSSATSITSISTPVASNEPSHHQFSMLSPKSSKLLPFKSSARASTSGQGSPPGRQSLSTPLPVVDEDAEHFNASLWRTVDQNAFILAQRDALEAFNAAKALRLSKETAAIELERRNARLSLYRPSYSDGATPHPQHPQSRTPSDEAIARGGRNAILCSATTC
jgi:hypothetical protein